MIVDVPRMMACGLLVVVGCGAPMPVGNPGAPDGGSLDGPPVDVPEHIPGMPGAGAHALSFYRYRAGSPSSIATAPMATHPTGSTIVVAVGRGDATAFALPTDNKGNTAQQLGAMHAYTMWPTSGTALYAVTPEVGGANYMVSTTTLPDDEITLAAVEVIEGSRIQAYDWNEVTSGPLTSKTVTTTGPATLIAVWWGDAFAMVDQTATPDNGFVVVDSVLLSGSLVQSTVAVRNVTAAGAYHVTWTATPVQGAQLWLIAVQ
jgi:hypothetical protein